VAASQVKIRWTAMAADDLESAHDYLEERNPERADALIERILSSIDVLERYPQLGREGRLPGIRELVVTGTPFVVYYRLRHDQAEILSVLHGSRKWPESF
jgi:toxin ParE1/3/4